MSSRHVPTMFRDPFLRDIERDFWGDRVRTSSPEFASKLFDQHFGHVLPVEEPGSATSSLYHRSRRAPKDVSGLSSVVPTKEKLTICLDVPQFMPEELKVRVSNAGVLEVEGKHGERPDEQGSISRHFVRKYTMPEDAILDLVSSSLSADGVLTVEAPRRPPEPPRPAEREVPIYKTEKKAAE